jgi:UDP-MurNAc hydroxylase
MLYAGHGGKVNFKYLRGACIIIEGGGKRVMCDPWLDDGIYYGSWAHYPAYDWRDDLNVDYIYVSHIHPDHVDANTMKRLPKVPVLIHKFKSKFLKSNIEAMGFEVRELENGTETDLGGLKINIIAADNCDPAVCQKFFGCTSSLVGDTQIDSMAIFQDGHHTYANVNDCPYQLSRTMLPKVKLKYPDIDVLFVAYAGAGPYPQCFEMPEYLKFRAVRTKKEQFLAHAAAFARDLGAKQTFPFAGDYALCGKFVELNRLRGIATLDETYRYFDTQGIPVIRIANDEIGRDKYVRDVLSKRNMDYETDKVPTEEALMQMLRAAWPRFDAKRKEIGLNTNTAVYIAAGETLARIPLTGNHSISQQKRIFDTRYIKMTVDPRLLARVLSGPRQAHWNNCEIGSHIQFMRSPDHFERGIHQAMGFLHV